MTRAYLYDVDTDASGPDVELVDIDAVPEHGEVIMVAGSGGKLDAWEVCGRTWVSHLDKVLSVQIHARRKPRSHSAATPTIPGSPLPGG